MVNVHRRFWINRNFNQFWKHSGFSVSTAICALSKREFRLVRPQPSHASTKSLTVAEKGSLLNRTAFQQSSTPGLRHYLRFHTFWGPNDKCEVGDCLKMCSYTVDRSNQPSSIVFHEHKWTWRLGSRGQLLHREIKSICMAVCRKPETSRRRELK